MADDFSIFERGSGVSEDVAPTDEFAQFESAEPSIGEKASTFGKSAVGGAVEFGPIVPSMIAGAAASPFFPPLGAVVGGTAGWYTGSKVRESLSDKGMAVENVEDLPDKLKPYGYAGESLGGSVGFGGAMTTAGKLGYQTAGKTAEVDY